MEFDSLINPQCSVSIVNHTVSIVWPKKSDKSNAGKAYLIIEFPVEDRKDDYSHHVSIYDFTADKKSTYKDYVSFGTCRLERQELIDPNDVNEIINTLPNTSYRAYSFDISRTNSDLLIKYLNEEVERVSYAQKPPKPGFFSMDSDYDTYYTSFKFFTTFTQRFVTKCGRGLDIPQRMKEFSREIGETQQSSCRCTLL